MAAEIPLPPSRDLSLEEEEEDRLQWPVARKGDRRQDGTPILKPPN